VDESGKWELRRRLVAARRGVPAAVREVEAAALASIVLFVGMIAVWAQLFAQL